MTDLVRYRVRAQVFVNNQLIDPQGRDDVFVRAAPGLEGAALELAPEAPPGGGDTTDPGTQDPNTQD